MPLPPAMSGPTPPPRLPIAHESDPFPQPPLSAVPEGDVAALPPLLCPPPGRWHHPVDPMHHCRRLVWRGPPHPQHHHDGYPSVGFKAPHLGLLAAARKRVDMRLADDPATCRLLPGSVFSAYQGGARPFRILVRVLAVNFFLDAAAAYSYYAARGQQSSLFPADWCSVDGSPVCDPAAAEAYFRSFTPHRLWNAPGARCVRTLVVQPLPSTEPMPPLGAPCVPPVAVPFLSPSPVPEPPPALAPRHRISHPVLAAAVTPAPPSVSARPVPVRSGAAAPPAAVSAVAARRLPHRIFTAVSAPLPARRLPRARLSCRAGGRRCVARVRRQSPRLRISG